MSSSSGVAQSQTVSKKKQITPTQNQLPSPHKLPSQHPSHQSHQSNGTQPLLGQSIGDPRTEDFELLAAIEAPVASPDTSLPPSMSTLAFETDQQRKPSKNRRSPTESRRQSQTSGRSSPNFARILSNDAFATKMLRSPEDGKNISLEEQQDMVGQSLSASLSNIVLDCASDAANGREASEVAPNPNAPSWQQLLTSNAAFSSGNKPVLKGAASVAQLETNVKSHLSEKLISRNSFSSGTENASSHRPQSKSPRSTCDLGSPIPTTTAGPDDDARWKVVGSPSRKSPIHGNSLQSQVVPNSPPGPLSQQVIGGRVRAASVLEPSLFSSANSSLWSMDSGYGGEACDDSRLTILNPLSQYSHWTPETNSYFSQRDQISTTSLNDEGGQHEFGWSNAVSIGNLNDFGPIGSECRSFSQVSGFNGQFGAKGSFRNRSKSQSFAFSTSSSILDTGNGKARLGGDSPFHSSIPYFDFPSSSSFLQPGQCAELPAPLSSPNTASSKSPEQTERFTYGFSSNGPNFNFAPMVPDANRSSYNQNGDEFSYAQQLSSNPISISGGDRVDFSGNPSLHNLDVFKDYPATSGNSSSFAYSYPHPPHFASSSGYAHQSNVHHAYDTMEEARNPEHPGISHNFVPQAKRTSPFQLNSYKGPLHLVEFKSGRTEIMYVREIRNRPEFKVRINDYVIVEADRGEDLGKVVGNISIERMKQIMNDPNSTSLTQSEIHSGIGVKEIVPKLIHRLARPADVRLLQTKAQEEAIAMLRCQSKVQQQQLPMEVVDAEYQWDRNKLTFYFIAQRRIDFRELVRDLFRVYKTRIWMCAVDKHRLKLLMSQNALPEGHSLSVGLDGDYDGQYYEDLQDDFDSLN